MSSIGGIQNTATIWPKEGRLTAGHPTGHSKSWGEIDPFKHLAQFPAHGSPVSVSYAAAAALNYEEDQKDKEGEKDK